MTPWPLALGVVAPIAGRLADKVRAGLIGGIGLAIFAVGLFMLVAPGDRSRAPSISRGEWRVCGIGFGLFQSPNNRTIVSSAPRNRSGAAVVCWRLRGCSARRRARWRSVSPFTC